jgi:hypothetical protein
MEAIDRWGTRVHMSEQEESALWRKRYFEAQAGMERYLIETYGGYEIGQWLPVKAEILKGLDVPLGQPQGSQGWKERFFKTQARLEKYVVEHHGMDDLERWALAIAQVFKYTESNVGGGAADIARRLAKQAQCYRSDYEITYSGQRYARVALHHCAIWDYREVARSRGVHLTLASPCTYCTRATAANIRAKGYSAKFALHEDGSGHGCTWEIEGEHTGSR